MSRIAIDWAPTETKAPPAAGTRSRSREEEFSLALERYIADYRRHHATLDREVCSPRNVLWPVFRGLVGWPRWSMSIRTIGEAANSALSHD
jgi:hypothetical protein